MEVLDKLFKIFFDYIDSLNKKLNDVLTMDFTNFSKKNKECKCGKKKDLEQEQKQRVYLWLLYVV